MSSTKSINSISVNAEENNPQVVVKEANFVEPEAKKEEAPVAEPAPAKSEKGLVVKVKTETWVEVKNENKLYFLR